MSLLLNAGMTSREDSVMNPITGPFTRHIVVKGLPIYTGFSPDQLVIDATYYKQKQPYDLPLTYTLEKKWYDQRLTFGTYEGAPNLTSDGWQYEANAQIVFRNKAYEKFRASVYEQSQWANNLIEARKTLDTGINAVKNLITFTRKVRRFDFIGAAKSLGITKPRGVSRRQKFSDNWLAYHFGVEPLVQDIHAGIQALCRDFKPFPAKGRAKGVYTWVEQTGSLTQGNRKVTSIDFYAQMGGMCRIVNPNISLAEELGLINPASVVWEAVPFSFVVDWFTNVGQVLASASDFVGKELTKTYTTAYQVNCRHTRSWGVVPGNLGPPQDGPWSTVWQVRSCYMRRTQGITGPTLVLKPFKGFSVTRGATAVALLLQLFK
jgi:hypothetical protein